MDNMRSILNKHNASELTKQPRTSTTASQQRSCNCQTIENCPLRGNCLNGNLIYQADVTTADNRTAIKYLGMTANPFKTRYNNHKKSFRNAKYSKETAVSIYI